jgi:hypothetical protein
MGKTIIVCTCLALAAVTVYPAHSAPEDTAAGALQDQEGWQNLIPRLRSLEAAESNDAEIQLGLAILYRRYDSSTGLSEMGKAQCNRVLELDPNSKAAWEIRTTDTIGYALRVQRDLVDSLERLIDNAERNGRSQVYIRTGRAINDPNRDRPWHSPLSDLFGDKSGNSVKIEGRDYDQARAKVRQQADYELSQALNGAEEAERHDPQNALYNYLKAELYFELRQPASAVQELQAAVRKPFVRRYVEEKEKAITKVLHASDAPPALRSHIEPRRPFGSYMELLIWEPYLKPLVTEMEDGGKFDQAKEVCDLATGIAKQIREEPLPYDSAYNKQVSTQIEQWATKRLAALDKRKAEKSTPPDDGPQNEKK